MKLLLTGGTGQVGTEFLRRAAGMNVLAPKRAELDLAQPASIRPWLDRHRPDAILSVGAYTAVDKAEDEPELAHSINAGSVAELADYSARLGCPLLHLSTDYVFDGSQSQAYLETDETAPLGVYGQTKFAGELAAQAAPQHLILRISWVFAAHGGNFLRTMLTVGAERDQLRVVDDQIGGPTWAGHVAEALHLLVERIHQGRNLPWGTWHYGGAPHVSWHAFACAIFDEALARGLMTRKPDVAAIRSEEYPTRAKRPANSCLDHRRSLEVLGLPVPDWRDGLQQVFDEIAASC